MKTPSRRELDGLWTGHNAEWRDPAQIASQWTEAGDIDPKLLDFKVRGAWWDVLETRRMTLLVTREYEHLVMAFTVLQRKTAGHLYATSPSVGRGGRPKTQHGSHREYAQSEPDR